MGSHRIVVLLLAAALAFAASPAAELNLQIDPLKEECFHERANAGEVVDAKVLVYRGGKLDIKMRIEAPDKSIVYDRLIFSNIDDATGSMLSVIVKKGYTWTASATGEYTICLDNTMARWTAKVVVFELSVTDPLSTVGDFGFDSAKANSSDAVESMRVTTQRLHAKLQQIDHLQSYHYHRERQHRNTAESTNSRVQWWTVAETGIILTVVTVQVFIVRSWFVKPTALPGGV